jgi:hypothetical protein
MMTENVDLTVESWCKGFADHMRRQGVFCRNVDVSDDSRIYEFYSVVHISPQTSLWKMSAIAVITPDKPDPISHIHQGFLEYAYQGNSLRQIIISDHVADDGLLDFLQSRQIIFIDLTNHLAAADAAHADYEWLSGLLFPSISSDEIAALCSGENGPPLEEQREPNELLRELILDCPYGIQNVMNLFPVLLPLNAPEQSEFSPNSLTIKPLFCAVEYTCDDSRLCNIYPNKLGLQKQLFGSTGTIVALDRLGLDTPLRAVAKGVRSLHASIAHVSLAMVYGDNILQAVKDFREGLAEFATDDCLSMLSEQFLTQPFDVQEVIISCLIQINLRSVATRRTLLAGARSRVKRMALRCISLLADFGYREAIPLLEELALDRRKAVSEAASAALQEIQPRDDPYELFERQSKSVFPSETTAEGLSQDLTERMFSRARKDRFFAGPNGTNIHVGSFGDDSTQGFATTYHEDGTRDVAIGEALGLFSYVAGCLTGEITPSEDHRVGMGEAIISHPDGSVKRISLDGKDDPEENQRDSDGPE